RRICARWSLIVAGGCIGRPDPTRPLRASSCASRNSRPQDDGLGEAREPEAWPVLLLLPAPYAGSTKPAVATRILREVLLVIVLGIEELRRGFDGRGDGAVTMVAQESVVDCFRRLRSSLL